MDVVIENVPLKPEDLDRVVDLEATEQYKFEIDIWHRNFGRNLNEYTLRDDKTTDDLMLRYYSILKQRFVHCKERSMLKGKLLLHIRYFYSYYKSIGDEVDTIYFIRMEDILAYYCTLELELVHSVSKQGENKKYSLSAIKRLCKILGIYLHHKLKYIINVLLKVKYNIRSPACQTVMRRVYCHFLMTTPSEPLSDEVFCRYYLAFERYKQITKPEEHQKLGEFVFRKFGKTEDYLKTNPVTKRVLSPNWKTVPDAVPVVIDWLASAIKEYFVYLKGGEIPRGLCDIDMNSTHNDFTNDSDLDIQEVPKKGVMVIEDFDDMQMFYVVEETKSIKTIDLSTDPQQTTNKATCLCSSNDISVINDEMNTYESPISLSSSDKQQNQCDEEIEIIDDSTHCQVMETTQDVSENSVPSSCATSSVVNSKSNEDINNSHNTSDQISQVPSTASPPVIIPNSEETEVVLNNSEETSIDSETAQKNSEKTSENIDLPPNPSPNSAAQEVENQQPASIILPYELPLTAEPNQTSQEVSEETSLSKGTETVEHGEESWNTNSDGSILAPKETVPLENETSSEFCALTSIPASSLVQSPNFLSQTPTSKPQHAADNGEITTSYIGSVTTDMASKYTQDIIHGEKSISISALNANLPDDIFIEATLPASTISADDNESIPESTCIYPDTNNHYSRGDDIISHAMTALFDSYSETESNDAANTSEMDIKETIVYAPSDNILDSDGQINTDRDGYSNTEVYSEAGQFLMEYNIRNSRRTTSTKSSRKKSKSRKQKKKLFEKEYSSKSSEKYTEPQKVLYTSGVIDNYSKTEMNGDKDIDGVLSGPVSTLLIVIPQHAEETLEIDSFSSGGYNVATSTDKKSVHGKPSVHFSDSVETRYIPSSCNCSDDEEQNYIIHDGIKCYVGDHKIIWNTEIKFLLKKLTTVADGNLSVTEKPITGNHNTKKTCIRQKIDYGKNAPMKGETFQNDIDINPNNIPTNVHTHVFSEVGAATGNYIGDPVYNNNNNETAVPFDVPQSNSNSPKLFLNVEQIQPCHSPIPTTLSNMEATAVAGALNYHPFVNEEIVLEKECNTAMEETRILPPTSECSFQTFPNQFLHYPGSVPNTFYIHNIETGIIVDSSNRCLFTNAEINPENRNEISLETSIRQENAANSPSHFLFANPEMDSKKTNDMPIDATIPQDSNFEFSNSPKLYNSEQLQSYLVPIDENYVVADNVGNCRILLSNNSNYYDLKLNIDMSANHSIAERDISVQENAAASMLTCSSKDNLITTEMNYPVEAWSDDGTFFLFMPPGYSSGYSSYDNNLRKEAECDIVPPEQEPYLPHETVIPAQTPVTHEYYKDIQLQPTVATHNTHSNVQNLNKINEMSERKSEIKTISKEARKRSDMESKKMPFKKRRLITEHDVSYSTRPTYIPESSVKTAAERKVYPSNFSSSSYGDLHENIRSSYMQGHRIIVNGYISPPRRRGRPKKRPLEEEYITKKRRR